MLSSLIFTVFLTAFLSACEYNQMLLEFVEPFSVVYYLNTCIKCLLKIFHFKLSGKGASNGFSGCGVPTFSN